MTYFERHDAIVTNVDDPDKIGRLKVKCPTLLDEEQELPFWIPPRFHFVQVGGGYFGIPAKDTWVELLVPVGSEVDEVFDEQSLQMEGSGLRWECTAYNDIQKLHDIFKTNYPNRYGYAWPNGWLWLVDTKDEIMVMGLVPDPDGEPTVSITLDGKTKSVFIFNKEGTSIELNDQKIEIRATNGLPIILDADNVFVGDGNATEHIPLGDALFSFLNTVATGWGATHTHSFSGAAATPDTFTGTCSGVTGAPVVPMDVPVQLDLLSGKHTVEK